MSHDQLVEQARTAPIVAAFAAASAAAAALDADHASSLWPAGPVPNAAFSEAAYAEASTYVVSTLAPFVRQNPQAPTEALFIQGRLTGIHAHRDFAGQPQAIRVAYELFRTTLLTIDRLVTEDVSRAPADPAAASGLVRHVVHPLIRAPIGTNVALLPRVKMLAAGEAVPVKPDVRQPPITTAKDDGRLPGRAGVARLALTERAIASLVDNGFGTLARVRQASDQQLLDLPDFGRASLAVVRAEKEADTE